MAAYSRALTALMVALIAMGSGHGAELYVAAQDPVAGDANPGTQAQPFRSLARACELAGPGDTVFLRGGTYRETLTPKRSGEAGRPIRFVAMPGEQVTLSGADPLPAAWQQHQGSIYRLPTPLKFIQLLVDGRMLLEARWPNSSPADLMAPVRAHAGEGTGYEVLADPALPPGDWNGAIVLIWHGARWVSATRHIQDYQPGKSLRFDTDFRRKTPDKYHTSDPYLPRTGNPYILIGSLAGLDSPGEWFLDEAAQTVYLWAPDGQSPQGHAVEVKQRDYACDLSKLGFIEIKGLDILAAAVNMAEAHDCLLEDCRLRYVEHLRVLDPLPPSRNVMTGKNNEWRRCLVAYSATSALRIGGEDNRLINCVVHDADYLGRGNGGINLGRSVGARLERCTVFRAGRDTISHHGSKRIRLEYNDLYYGNMLNNDSGAIYCWGTDGEGGVIAHNWVHDNLGDSTCGIYLDNFSRNFVVHHNVVWNCSATGIRLNSDALNHLVCNNTITLVDHPFGTYTYSAYTPTMKGTRIINNLVNAPLRPHDPGQFVQGELGPELQDNGSGAIDRDGVPIAGSAAIDAGVAIAGITDGAVGKAPDLGAYEVGGERWVAGADWADPEAPPAPARDLTCTPQPAVTEQTMIRKGLVLWLDATDVASLAMLPNGTVQAWRDKSGGKHVASPPDPGRSVKWVADGLHGKPVLRGNGTGNLQIDTLKRGPGAVTALIVSQGLAAAGPAWQRLIACFTGEGQEWVLPNWMILRTGGEKPQAYPAQVFIVQQRSGAALDRLVILGAAASAGQNLAGDVAEVLVFDRGLRFDELSALEQYLKAKWGLAE